VDFFLGGGQGIGDGSPKVQGGDVGVFTNKLAQYFSVCITIIYDGVCHLSEM